MIITHLPININRSHRYPQNYFSSLYKQCISRIEFTSVICTHCGHNTWKYLAKYKRSFILLGRKYEFSVFRYYCAHCRRTHSILPDFLVPYVIHSSHDIIEALSHREISSVDDTLLSYWSNKLKNTSSVSHILLCIISKDQVIASICFHMRFCIFICLFI